MEVSLENVNPEEADHEEIGVESSIIQPLREVNLNEHGLGKLNLDELGLSITRCIGIQYKFKTNKRINAFKQRSHQHRKPKPPKQHCRSIPLV